VICTVARIRSRRRRRSDSSRERRPHSAILVAGYAYLSWRLTSSAPARLALAVPFLLIWIVPVIYWIEGRESTHWTDEVLHGLCYICMGWLNFLFVLSVGRDGLILVTAIPALSAVHDLLRDAGATWVFLGSLGALGAGVLAALRGPHVRHVDVPVEGLAPDLDGFRIVQISDLHIGPTIRRGYVRRVVDMTNELAPDLIALTGDIVDGPVPRLARHVAPVAELAQGGRAFLVLGNHDYYAGAGPWVAQFESMGLRVLLNSHISVAPGAARLIVGGVIDPAARAVDIEARPRPDLASAIDAGVAFRLLLAHNPKIAPLAESAGFDLQLSGHTHGDQTNVRATAVSRLGLSEG